MLIDEVDKADPDFANGLLVPLGSEEFLVHETGATVRVGVDGDRAPTAPPPHLIVITTNEERELPSAFLRRCVVAALPPPDRDKLIAVGRRHLELLGVALGKDDESSLAGLADRVVELRGTAREVGLRSPSIAEYLDAVHACRRLGVRVGGPVWGRIETMVLRKASIAWLPDPP